MNNFVAFYQLQLFCFVVLVCTSGMLTAVKSSDEKLASITDALAVNQSRWPK